MLLSIKHRGLLCKIVSVNSEILRGAAAALILEFIELVGHPCDRYDFFEAAQVLE